jgi:DNA processing protein
MDEGYLAALACLPGMSALSLPRLLSMAGGAEQLWGILSGGGRRASALVGSDKAYVWAEACRGKDPKEILKGLKQRGINVIKPEDPRFPEMLRSIYDPPALMFMVGREIPDGVPAVAVVGSRKASSYGRWVAETIGSELARDGIIVVSGAAYGVDAHAHLGSLKEGGFTIAVLGCGIDIYYPRQHAGLLRRIARDGCLISEYPPGDGPLPWHFPHRNRIIAGISHAVVVVEASARSGALITADMALEEGREVMAVPGPIGNPLSEGTNTLIQKGAKLVMGVNDICEELPFDRGLKRSRSIKDAQDNNGVENASPLESRCLELLQGGPHGLDWLAANTGTPPGELLATITSMSFKGWVAEEPGGAYRLLAKYPDP